MMRATISTGPPAAKPISHFTGRSGYPAAEAGAVPAAKLPTRLKMQTSNALRKYTIIRLPVIFLLRLRTCFHKSPRLPTTSAASFPQHRLRSKMKLAQMACAGILLLAGGAAAQDGGKTGSMTTKTTISTHISLGTATPGG